MIMTYVGDNISYVRVSLCPTTKYDTMSSIGDTDSCVEDYFQLRRGYYLS